MEGKEAKTSWLGGENKLTFKRIMNIDRKLADLITESQLIQRRSLKMTEILLLIEDFSQFTLNYGFERKTKQKSLCCSKNRTYFYLDVPLLILFSFPRLTFKHHRIP